MSQFFKYLLVALICLGIGALTGILIYNNLSPIDLLKKGLTTAEQVQGLAKEIPSALQGGEGKKDDKAPSGKEEEKTTSTPEGKGDKKNPQKEGSGDKKQDTSKEAKEGGDKKEGDAAKEDESMEYLRSLWPIKKRRPSDLSGEIAGKLYLEGTNPYGPPSTYKEDLFSETKALSLAGDPPLTIPPPLRKKPTPEPLPKHQSDSALPTLYQVEIGRFSSVEKAQEASDMLREKGEQTDIYYTGNLTNPDWFHVRLSSSFTKPQAYQKAKTIAILEKIVPTIVRASTDMKKIG